MIEDTSLREKALWEGWDALTEFKRSALAARQAFDHVVGDQHQPKLSKHGARNLAHLRKVFLEAKEEFPDFADTLAWLLWWSIKDFDRLAFLETGRVEAKDRRIEALKAALASQMHFLGEVAGTCLGLAMSGKDHPDPDGALMGLFNAAQSHTADVRAALSGKEGQS